jgi:hypothetical protein
VVGVDETGVVLSKTFAAAADAPRHSTIRCAAPGKERALAWSPVIREANLTRGEPIGASIAVTEVEADPKT